jgi:hypothetical protein
MLLLLLLLPKEEEGQEMEMDESGQGALSVQRSKTYALFRVEFAL